MNVLGHAVQDTAPEDIGTGWDNVIGSCVYSFVDLSQTRCHSTGTGIPSFSHYFCILHLTCSLPGGPSQIFKMSSCIKFIKDFYVALHWIVQSFQFLVRYFKFNYLN